MQVTCSPGFEAQVTVGIGSIELSEHIYFENRSYYITDSPDTRTYLCARLE